VPEVIPTLGRTHDNLVISMINCFYELILGVDREALQRSNARLAQDLRGTSFSVWLSKE